MGGQDTVNGMVGLHAYSQTGTRWHVVVAAMQTCPFLSSQAWRQPRAMHNVMKEEDAGVHPLHSSTTHGAIQTPTAAAWQKEPSSRFVPVSGSLLHNKCCCTQNPAHSAAPYNTGPFSAIHACAVICAALHLSCIAMSSTRRRQKHTPQLLWHRAVCAAEAAAPPISQSHAAAECASSGPLAAGQLQTGLHCCVLGASTAVDTSAGGHAAEPRKFLHRSVKCSHAWHHAGLAGVRRRACWRSASPAAGWRVLVACKPGGTDSCPERRRKAAPNICCRQRLAQQHLRHSAWNSQNFTVVLRDPMRPAVPACKRRQPQSPHLPCGGFTAHMPLLPHAACMAAWLLRRWRGLRLRGLRLPGWPPRPCCPQGCSAAPAALRAQSGCCAGAAVGDVAAERREWLPVRCLGAQRAPG